MGFGVPHVHGPFARARPDVVHLMNFRSPAFTSFDARIAF
jgi:hypothetical protein